MKIYSYWFGNTHKKEKLENKIIAINKKIAPHEIILGPTNKDHKYLLSKYQYYKNSVDQEVYAFASDVYRVYIINKYGGLWLDSNFIETINIEYFIKFINNLEKYTFAFVFENPRWCCNGFFYSKKSSVNILELILDEYHRRTSKNIREYDAGPYTLTKILLKSGILKTSLANTKKNREIFFIDIILFDFRKKYSPIYMNCQGSWHIGKPKYEKEDIRKLWIEIFDNFYNVSRLKVFVWRILRFGLIGKKEIPNFIFKIIKKNIKNK